MSEAVLEGLLVSVEDVQRPLVVVLQRRAHHQLPEPVPVHVGNLSQRRAEAGVLRAREHDDLPGVVEPRSSGHVELSAARGNEGTHRIT
ncbi:hypothetical protein F7725_023475 [Dissostichus mawsoni]|uniref:Uncharacterized protein n=1 Tax=Dissostichus mawsoni TaxID=36200 RepID=A0A7J5Z169_DISMA|nr:hypothetical protein F7725_023475 [Dissostichus mawsoni]